MKRKLLLFVSLCLFCIQLIAQHTYTNPLKPSGPDHWVFLRNGWYYYMNTISGNELRLWRTKNLGELAQAEEKTIFKPEEGKPYSKQLWAPEIHFLDNKWYIYFAADEGNNLHHRIWVLENENEDPFTGEWIMKGKLTDPGDHWAIDLTVIDYKGKSYFFYHNGSLPTGGSYRRSICVDYMYYNPDGTIQKIIQTTTGVEPVAADKKKKKNKG